MRLADLLPRALDELGTGGAWTEARVRRAWDAVAGEQVRARAEVVRLRGGVLEVAVSDDVWATELRYLGGEIARRINDELGEQVVREVVSRRRRRRPG